MSDCLFCQIVEKKIPAKIEYEDENLIVIQDINPQAPHHLLVIPKKHIERISQLTDQDADLSGKLILGAKKAAEARGFGSQFRLVFNNGEEAGQSVFHIHLHVLGGRRFSWPPG